MKILVNIFMFSMIFQLSSFGQENLILHGRIISEIDSTPVDFAHIGIPQHGIGTISNQEGEFKFFIPESCQKETIVISHVGYYPFSLKYNVKDSLVNNILLKPKLFQLEEITVVPIEVIQSIIKMSVKKLPENYPNNVTLSKGFYRETVFQNQNDKSSYSRLLEAAIDIQDKGIKSSPKTIKIKINELRKSDDLNNYSFGSKILKMVMPFFKPNQIFSLFFDNSIRSYYYNKSNKKRTWFDDVLKDNQKPELYVTYDDSTKIYLIKRDFI